VGCCLAWETHRETLKYTEAASGSAADAAGPEFRKLYEYSHVALAGAPVTYPLHLSFACTAMRSSASDASMSVRWRLGIAVHAGLVPVAALGGEVRPGNFPCVPLLLCSLMRGQPSGH